MTQYVNITHSETKTLGVTHSTIIVCRTHLNVFAHITTHM